MGAEQDIINNLRIDASKRGATLWRNNTGAATTIDGRLIRYGLANDSARVNRAIKSADLIGITPRVVGMDDIGKVMGVFTAIEVKRPGWKYSGKNERECAQDAFLKLVRQLGGVGYFSTGDLHAKL